MPETNIIEDNARTAANYPTPVYYIALFGIALSMALSYIVFNLVREKQIHDFEDRAIEYIAGVNDRLDVATASLRAIHALYQSSNSVTRKQFTTFVARLGVGDAVQALEWIPSVPASERSRYEKSARADGLTGFRFTERSTQGIMNSAGQRPIHYPVYFVEPMKGNESAVGFDLASNEARLVALEKARKTRQSTATSRILLVQETGDQYGFLVFTPIFREGVLLQETKRRNETHIGFALGVFRIGDLIGKANDKFVAADNPARISVLDLSAPKSQRRLFPKGGSDEHNIDPTEFSLSKTINVADRQWQIAVIVPGYPLWSLTNWQVWVTFAASLMTTFFVAYLVALSYRANQAKAFRQYAMELERSADALKKANQELGNFTHVASHDLQEPLRQLISFSQLLVQDLSGNLPPRAQSDLDHITLSAQRMQTLVCNLLELSKAGQASVTLEEISISGCVDHALEVLELQIKDSNAKITSDALPSLMVDSALVTQIYQNLIGNALKFTPEDRTPVVHVTARQTDGIWSLGVQDNGIGIELKYANQIFEPFKRLHGRAEYEGTGIGLALCSKIVERHEGRIWVESEPGQGSHFMFTLQKVRE